MVEADWPALTADEVRRVLGKFAGLDGEIALLSVSPRPFSAASVVRMGDKRVFIKRHVRAVRDRAALAEEHRFIEYLMARGAPVDRVLHAKSGETAIEMDAWTYEAHATPDGIDLYEEAISWTPFRCAAHARAAGAALARLHEAARGYEAPKRAARPLIGSFSIFAADDASHELEDYLTARPALSSDAQTRRDCDKAMALLKPFHTELRPLLSRIEPLWTHNDLHASNLFWSDDSDEAQATAIIDFGLADRTYAVHDLAVTIERNIVEWLKLGGPDVPVHFDHLAALLDGYASVRRLSTAEAAALAPMLAVCHAEFALTEADYFLGVLHAPERARVATHDYLVGHAEWFLSSAGQGLLDAVRGWAEEHAKGRPSR